MLLQRLIERLCGRLASLLPKFLLGERLRLGERPRLCERPRLGERPRQGEGLRLRRARRVVVKITPRDFGDLHLLEDVV